MASGRLVYASGLNLMAVAVDPSSMRMLGEPVVLTGVEIANTPDNGAAQFAISDSGSLVFLPPTEAGQFSTTLSWIDRNGREEPLGLAPGSYTNPRCRPRARASPWTCLATTAISGFGTCGGRTL